MNTILLVNTTFAGNIEEQVSGDFNGVPSVRLTSSSNIAILNCSFSDNQDVERGASLLVLTSDVNVTSSTFTRNSGKYAIVYLDQEATLRLSESEMTFNLAKESACFYAAGSSLVESTENKFLNNSAEQSTVFQVTLSSTVEDGEY